MHNGALLITCVYETDIEFGVW